MIILHGFLGTSDNWKTLGKQFSAQGFEVHLVDQRNHGRSPHDDQFSYDLLTRDLKTYCEDHQLENIVLLGHSMGGKTAMFFAGKYPDLISRLIVADISPRYYHVRHRHILDGLKALDFDELNSRKEADAILSGYVSEFAMRQFLLKNLFWKDKDRLELRFNLKVLSAEVECIGEALPAHYRYPGETLFIKGGLSDYILAADEVLIKEHFPLSEIHTISNTGHWPHAENPAEFYEQVMQFIS
jgi:pimeloyl-ACP methyl ester carboxylesterase